MLTFIVVLAFNLYWYRIDKWAWIGMYKGRYGLWTTFLVYFHLGCGVASIVLWLL